MVAAPISGDKSRILIADGPNSLTGKLKMKKGRVGLVSQPVPKGVRIWPFPADRASSPMLASLPFKI
jgi:hypothetical protein